jgi:adenosylcobinamide-GDP ribazoletransferase
MNQIQDNIKRAIQRTKDAIEHTWQQRSDITQHARSSFDQAWQQRSGVASALLAQYHEFTFATRFLTTLPVPGSVRVFRTDTSEPPTSIGAGYFPLIGLLIGGLLCILPLALGQVLPSSVLAVLVLIGQILLTGGLHLDGLMDSCDGFFGGTSREQKLEIMRDSRVGSFGVLGGVSILLFKFAVFASLGLPLLYFALLIIPAVARWAMVVAVYIFPTARPTGLGAAFRQTVTQRRLILAGVLALLIAVLIGHIAGFFLWLGATLVALLVGIWAIHHLGGLTGDVYGAIVEVAEVFTLFLIIVLRFWL